MSPRPPSDLPLDEPGLRELADVLRPAWVRLDLDALEHNYRHVTQRVAPAAVLAVVKADAYGHGACQVARTLEQAGVPFLGVALVEEGIELRRAGVEAPVLVFGTARIEQLPLFRRYRLTPIVSSMEQLGIWCSWAAGSRSRQTLHLEVDTGMARLGLAPEEVAEALDRVRQIPELELVGFASHLAEADRLESDASARQEACFQGLLELLTEAEKERVWLHLANSAGALHHPSCRYSLVRAGMALLGIDPVGDEPELRPVMSVRTQLVQVRTLPAGAKVSYGGRTTLTRRTRVGVAPVGYADGLPWRLTGNASMLGAGQRLAVLGAVTMDMTMVDVTDIEGQVGDEIVVMGEQEGERITAQELAERAGTISYEILTGFGLRLPRSYHRAGRWIELATHRTHAGGSSSPRSK